MLEIRCADSGTICPGVLQAFTKDELHRQLATHLSREHHVKRPTRTIMNYMAGLAQTVDVPPRAGERSRAP